MIRDYRDNEDIGDLADGSDEDDFDFNYAKRTVQNDAYGGITNGTYSTGNQFDFQ